jgi:hypothetical protein
MLISVLTEWMHRHHGEGFIIGQPGGAPKPGKP